MTRTLRQAQSPAQSLLVSLLIVLAAALSPVVVGTPAAQAAVCPAGGLCGGGGGGASDPSPNPGGGAGTGGGASLPPGHFAHIRIWRTTTSPPVDGCLGACRPRQSGAHAAYRQQCRGENRWGPWEGVEAVETGRLNFKPGSKTSPGHTWFKDASYDCISAAAWTETPIQCVVSYVTRVAGPMRSPLTKSETTPTHVEEETAFAQTGNRKPVLCERSRTLRVNHTLGAYGNWRIVAKPRVVTCTLFEYHRVDARTQVVPADRTGDCTRPEPVTRVGKAHVFCERPGWAHGWTQDHAFTPQDCLTRPNGIWSCGPQVRQTPTLAGRPANPAQVLNDGNDLTLRWPQPAPQGRVSNLADHRLRLNWLTGTPFRAGVAPAAATQPFVVNPTIGDWVFGWRGLGAAADTDFIVNFQAPSVAERPWTAAPEWAFTADFAITAPQVGAIDALTGEWTATEQVVWQRMPAICTGAPGRITVFSPRHR